MTAVRSSAILALLRGPTRDSAPRWSTDLGKVVGVAFAIAPDKPDVAYALSIKESRNVLAEPRRPESAPAPASSESGRAPGDPA